MKRQANILSSLITNFETVEDVIKTSANSAGSALAENEKYLDSIQGRLDLFNNAVQTLWMNLLDSGVIKGVVDIGTMLIKLLDTIYGKIIAIVGAFALYKKFKDGVKFSDMFKSVSNVTKEAYSSIMKMVTATQTLTKADIARSLASKGVANKLTAQIIAEASLKGVTGALTAEQIKATAATLSAKFANGELSVSQYLAIMSTMGLKTALQGLWTVLKTNPVYAVAAAVSVAALAFDYFHTTAHEAADAAQEAFDDIQSVVDSTTSTIQSIESELSTLQDQIESLEGRELSFADNQELERLRKQREELEHSLKVQENLLDLQKQSQASKAVQSMKAYTKATSQGAEETENLAKTIFTTIGVLAGGAIGAAFTGGASLAASIGIIAAGGIAGGIVGNKGGEALGSYAAENDGTYDDWYRTYKTAIETAQAEEEKALAEYEKDTPYKEFILQGMLFRLFTTVLEEMHIYYHIFSIIR